MKADENTPVYNVYPGKVIQTQKGHVDLGNWIIVESKINNEKVQIWYAHLKSFNISQDDIIKGGLEIAKSGKTGNASKPSSAGPHLHLTARIIKNKKWKKVDPGRFLSSTFNKNTGKSTSPCK